MSLKAYFEFCLNLKDYKNIDLYNQGLYMQRIQIYEEKDGMITYAQPYNSIDHHEQKKNRTSHQNDFFDKSQINEKELYYQRTKSYLVKFNNEELDIDEIVQFRLEVDAYPNFKELNIFMVCTLYFADLSKIGQQGDEMFQQNSEFKIKINQYWNSIHEFLPLMYDEGHFSIIQGSLHCHLVDIRFKLTETQLKLIDNLKSQEPNQYMSLDLLTPKTFLEFLNQICFKYGRSQINIFYDEYIKQMRESYLQLVQFYQHIVKQIKQNFNNNQNFFNSKPLELPVYMLKYQQMFKKKANENVRISDLLLNNTVQEKDIVSQCIQQEINYIGGLNLELWQHLVNLVTKFQRLIALDLQVNYTKLICDKWGEWQFRDVIETEDFSFGQFRKEDHTMMANQLRKQPKSLYQSLMKFYDYNMFPKQEFHPVIFEEIYKKKQNPFSKQYNQTNSRKQNYYDRNNIFQSQNQHNTSQQQIVNQPSKGKHLLVLVHGFQGSSYDMHSLKNNINLMFIRKNIPQQQYEFLCSQANEDCTEGSIQEMGNNLANEVHYKLEQVHDIQRISFIGHSLGGLIIRACLPSLIQYKDKMFTYMSLSSPHLGYMQNKSTLVDAGLWLLKQLRNSVSLQQLTMEDSSDIENSFLYRLSYVQGLDWFTNIAFLSSFQDKYVPFESARIQKLKSSNQQSEKAKKYSEMVQNIMNRLNNHKLHRIDVDFIKSQQKMLDNIIGRHAHIQFIEDQTMMRMIAFTYEHIFL